MRSLTLAAETLLAGPILVLGAATVIPLVVTLGLVTAAPDDFDAARRALAYFAPQFAFFAAIALLGWRHPGIAGFMLLPASLLVLASVARAAAQGATAEAALVLPALGPAVAATLLLVAGFRMPAADPASRRARRSPSGRPGTR